MATSTAFAYLVELDKRARDKASPLPRQEELKDAWTGMGFRLDRSDMVVPLDQIHEVLTIPTLTAIPGAKKWVRGIANVRGSLLPILDLRGFLGLAEIPESPLTRILVVNHQGIFAGLIVDQIWGLKHFFLDQTVQRDEATGAELTSQMHPYIPQGFKDSEKIWPVFSLHSIAEDSEFLQVAR